ncbi:MAG: TetR family transcriptional regulator [Acidobacteria bacterium]|nr:TetR family transcriptional regulator [Acidobacteriota bacterium]MBV9145582.1 TetR family transcriptional regulator [Acidobacteriota bacterium]MBV9436693.1 TetR family transcriptional regulator [Acidobacteriota bacterium]
MTITTTANEAVRARSTPKAEATRRRIYDAALEMFRDKGFEQTTMRDIARQAGVALGAAYYYFDSKDAIVLAFYQENEESGHQPTLDAIAQEKKLRDRIRVVMERRFELLEPNLKFLGALFKHSPDATDPLSPFSDETRPIRERAIELFRVATSDADVKVPADLVPHLPRLLWLYQLSLILFWIYDRSEEKKGTMLLMEKSLALVVNLIRLSGLPLMRPVRRTVLELLEVVAA